MRIHKPFIHSRDRSIEFSLNFVKQKKNYLHSVFTCTELTKRIQCKCLRNGGSNPSGYTLYVKHTNYTRELSVSFVQWHCCVAEGRLGLGYFAFDRIAKVDVTSRQQRARDHIGTTNTKQVRTGNKTES